MRNAIIAVTVLLVTAAQAAAQEKKFDVNVGGGFTFTTGEVEDHLGDGGNFDLGFTYMVTPMIGIQAQYGYTGLAGKDFQVPVASVPGGPTLDQSFSVNMHMHGGSFDALVKPPMSGRASAYFLGGPGVYHRNVNLTTPSVGFATVCDPYWYVCFPTAVPVDQIIGERSSTDFGINFGGGVNFKIAEHLNAYAELRYLYVWGPEVTAPQNLTTTTTATKANGQFLPITFGLRW